MLDTGDTAWMLTSSALVLLMVPGLALFYGGMVRSRSVLNMMMMCLSSLGVVAILWILYGYSIAFGGTFGGLLGDPAQFVGLRGLLEGPDAMWNTIPAMVFVAFQGMFAILTVALISGAAPDRLRFAPWVLFAGLWATLVYFPVAHWVFGEGWILNSVEAIDFAGGTAVHINSGAAALVLAIVLGKRLGWPREAMRPHNLPLVMLGAGLLWFGWFGFNAGSAGAADGVAGVAFINTVAATAAAMLAWLMVERVRDGRPTSLGLASGVVAGLVAITPACTSVSPLGAIGVGAIAGAVCAFAVTIKYRLGYDDSLDVVAVHLVGGLVGTLLVGFFATSLAPAGVDGLFYGGGVDQLWRQAVGAGAVLIYSLIMTAIIVLVLKYTIGLRVDSEAELTSIDEAEHAEAGYEFTGIRAGTGSSMSHAAESLSPAKVTTGARTEG